MIAGLPFQSPKLAVVMQVDDDGTFAQRLEAAIARSSAVMGRVIEHDESPPASPPMILRRRVL